jgi:hypothetical protein
LIAVFSKITAFRSVSPSLLTFITGAVWRVLACGADFVTTCVLCFSQEEQTQKRTVVVILSWVRAFADLRIEKGDKPGEQAMDVHMASLCPAFFNLRFVA